MYFDDMEISETLTDPVLLEEIGKRITVQRIHLNLTQSDLAADAAVSKRTVERLESGQSTQLVSFLRIMRSLKLLGRLEAFLPPAKASPIELLKNEGQKRQRVRTKKKEKQTWQWGDES